MPRLHRRTALIAASAALLPYAKPQFVALGAPASLLPSSAPDGEARRIQEQNFQNLWRYSSERLQQNRKQQELAIKIWQNRENNNVQQIVDAYLNRRPSHLLAEHELAAEGARLIVSAFEERARTVDGDGAPKGTAAIQAKYVPIVIDPPPSSQELDFLRQRIEATLKP
jgi:hypothetical protein